MRNLTTAKLRKSRAVGSAPNKLDSDPIALLAHDSMYSISTSLSREGRWLYLTARCASTGRFKTVRFRILTEL